MRKSEDIVAIIFGVVLILIIIGILVVLARQTSTTRQQGSGRTPTSKPVPTTTSAPLNGRPQVYYNEKAEDKLLDAIKQKKTLSHDDVVAKAKILATLPPGQQSGSLYYNADISIEYIHSADLFQVEILTTDIKTAKDEANVWLRARGLSQNAICTLPVEFYLNYDIANQLRQSTSTFNPLANGCAL
jgi:hypothetical protein